MARGRRSVDGQDVEGHASAAVSIQSGTTKSRVSRPREADWVHATRILVAVLIHHGVSRCEAMDLAQSMICKLFLDLQVSPGTCTNPVGVLIWRAQPAAISWRRGRARRREEVLPDERLVELEACGHAVVGSAGAEMEPGIEEVRTLLRGMWPRLGEPELDLLILRHVKGLAAPQVAAAWGWSLDQVKRAYARIGRILHLGGGYKRPSGCEGVIGDQPRISKNRGPARCRTGPSGSAPGGCGVADVLAPSSHDRRGSTA